MAIYNKYQPFLANMPNKKYNLASDQLKVALTIAAPAGTEVKLSDLTEISYTNLSGATPLNLTTTSSTQTAGTYSLILADLTLTATGAVGPFQYVTIYDSAATNFELIGWYNYGSSVTLAAGDQFVINLDNVNGLFQIA